ncbi:venom phosphodiesterase 1 [Chanos chanos]|uniref:Venom phosphodiesterase 1 n=1 Tax=Chanos chanos TaxID=29144 RepID=A0A6J2WGY6_CHACN|nr:venom phosphodiesterase 1-like [Chanos chanos]
MAFSKSYVSRKQVIIIGILAVSVVIIILGLGLGLGLQLENCRKPDVLTSCRNRCYEPFDDETQACRCDEQCVTTNSCCYDFKDTCLQPNQSWECTTLRCGEARVPGGNCHCSDDCLSAGDCCTNYKSVCHGETEWVEDECSDMTPKCPASFKREPLLLISLDGLRAEYMKTWHHVIPVLEKLRQCGTSSPYMQAVFPSKTFPNHYSIVTGLYAESHGLVDNNMYDPEFDASFSLSNSEKDKPRWYLGQPIWNTVMSQGLRAGTFFWPGSDVPINGTFPNIYEPYNGKIPFEQRVFTVLKWLQLPEQDRPDFFTLYLEEPDKSGHSFGPVSGGLIAALQGVDKIIGQLMNGLKQLNLHQCVNIIIVADHGMEETSCGRKEVLEHYVGDVGAFYVYEGPVGRIRARNKDQPFAAAELVANMTCKKPDQKIKAYLKAHLPKRFHFANSRRIEEVGVIVEPRWLFERYPGSLTFCDGGQHGYDNDVYSMQAMFLSHGPKFQPKTEVEPFSNIELYNLMCDLLEVSPAENNGTHGSMNHLLQEPFFTPTHPQEKSLPGQCPLLTLTPSDTLGCNCSALDELNLNSRLNLTASQVLDSEKRHLPFGRPRLLWADEDYCILHHEGYVSAYSHSAFMPMWTSFTIDRPLNSEPMPGVLPDCLRADVRIPASQSATCDQYSSSSGKISPVFLYPPNLNKTAEQQFDALIMSNVVPVFPEFKRIWDYLQTVLLKTYASQFNGVNVVTGPVFDYNYDGRYDTADLIQQFVPGTGIPIPTHYFVVLTSCSDASLPVHLCDQDLQTVSFLIPHREDNSESCSSSEAESQWVEDLLWFHQSRVRDVEWITGLDFYQDSGRPIAELLRVKTRPTAAIHRQPSA